MNNELTLKPCPFCGRIPIIICNRYRQGEESFQVQCSSVGRNSYEHNFCPIIPMTYEHRFKEDAVYAWNTRMPEEATDE